MLKSMKEEKHEFKSYLSFLLLIIFCLITYWPFFLHLTSIPIVVWDESRLAINAFEMYQAGGLKNYIVTHYAGEPDMWNTKPPLLIWAQVLCMKLFTPGELAVRLPSAIASFLTAFFILLFAVKYIKDYWFGLIAVLILVTTNNYISLHAARTGDYEALLTLFTTIYPLSFFLFTETGKNKFLHLFFLALTLSVLTKSIQGLFFLPAIFIYLFISRNLHVFKNKWFYIDLAFLIFFIFGYYLTREYYNPGYLEQVWGNELGGRYSNAAEEHREIFLYYYDIIINPEYFLWYWLIPCGFVAGICFKNLRIRRLTYFSSLLIITYWLIVSSAQTKLEWYIVPLFPFLSLVCSVIIYFVFIYLKEESSVKKYFDFNILPYIFLFIVFLIPYKNIVNKVYKPADQAMELEFYNISFYLQDAVKQGWSLDNQYICYEGYNAQLLFYVKLLNQKGQDISFKNRYELKQGDTVIASQPDVLNFIEKNYEYTRVMNNNNVNTYTINGNKPND